MISREEELRLIAEHVATRGVTLLPEVTDPLERALEKHRELKKLPNIERLKRNWMRMRDGAKARRRR